MTQGQGSFNVGPAYCGYCGTRVSVDDSYCPNCGQPVHGQTTPTDPEVTPDSGTGSPVQRDGLGPLRLGDLLRKTVLLIWRNPLLFLGIGLIPQLLLLAGSFFSIDLLTPALSEFPGQEPELAPTDIEAADVLLLIVLALAAVLLSLICHGAAIYAVGVRELGLSASLVSCFGLALRRTVPLVLGWLALLVALVSLFVPIILIGAFLGQGVVLLGVPWAIFLLVSLWFYPQVIIFERRGPLASLVRSRELVKNNWWRIFGVATVYVVIYIVFQILVEVAIVSPLSLASTVLGLVIGTLIGSISVPWIAVGSTLLYFDLRMRKEGFNLQALSSDLSASSDVV